jgi:hypothetical protein
MATPNPNELNETIRQIQERINQLFGEEKRYYEDALRSLQGQNAELEKFKILFRDIVNASSELNRELIDTATYFRRSVAELSKQNSELSNAKNALKSISKIASEIAYENSQNSLIEEKTLKELEKKAKLQFDSLKIAIQSGQIQGVQLISLKEAYREQENFFNTLVKIREKQKEVKKDTGVRIFSGLEDISAAIPGLGKFTSAFKDASKASQEQAMYNQRMFGSVKAMSIEEQKSLNDKLDKYKQLRDQGVNINSALQQAGVSAQQVKFGKMPLESISALRAGINSLGPALAKALGPLALLAGLVDAFIKSDKIVGDMAKGMNMTYDEALGMKRELTEAASYSGDMFVTSKGMAESLMAINKTLGTNVMLNKEDLITFTKLRETAGLTNEELMGIQSLSLTNGKSLKQNTGEILAQAKISSLRNGIVLNEKEILKEIGKVSAATTLTLGKNPKALADAVAQAKSLGLEMAQLEKIADGLLNFEQSIGSELEAELLTGRQLNLEQARYYALMGQTGNLAKELSAQLGSAEEFGKMNVIQQEALAKSFGMSREELAKSLFIQDQLKGATGEEAKVRERRLNALIAEKGLGEAQRLLEEEGIGNLEKQAGMQERFAKAVEKLQEVFTVVVEAMMPILSILSEALVLVGYIVAPFQLLVEYAGKFGEMISNVVGPLNIVGKILKVVVGGAIVWAAFATFAAISTALAATVVGAIAAPVLGGIAAAAVLAAGFGALSKVGDINSPAKGKTVVSTKEGGLFELSPNDDLVAAPGASQIMSQNSSPSMDISPLMGKIDMLLQTNKEANNLLSQLVKKDTSVNLDGAKVSKGIALSESRLG